MRIEKGIFMSSPNSKNRFINAYLLKYRFESTQVRQYSRHILYGDPRDINPHIKLHRTQTNINLTNEQKIVCFQMKYFITFVCKHILGFVV